jgi:hypothetical protein
MGPDSRFGWRCDQGASRPLGGLVHRSGRQVALPARTSGAMLRGGVGGFGPSRRGWSRPVACAYAPERPFTCHRVSQRTRPGMNVGLRFPRRVSCRHPSLGRAVGHPLKSGGRGGGGERSMTLNGHQRVHAVNRCLRHSPGQVAAIPALLPQCCRGHLPGGRGSRCYSGNAEPDLSGVKRNGVALRSTD